MICKHCKGEGKVVDATSSHGEVVNCPECAGLGEVRKNGEVVSLRIEVPRARVERALLSLHTKLDRAIKIQGSGAFVSLHEIRGAVGEEVDEANDASHEGDVIKVREELLDVAVAALWGVVSIDTWEAR